MKTMHYYEVAPNQIARPDSGAFTYSSADDLLVGQIVVVEVGKKKLIGIILESVKKPSYDVKPIQSALPYPPLPKPLVKLALWLSAYYATHLALVIQSILPSGMQKSRRPRLTKIALPIRKRTNIVFNKDQSAAVQKIEAMSAGSAILHGVTGAGKTAVYIELAKRTLARGQSVILLVPEIALTSQLVDEFSYHFEGIILTHSRQTEAERHQAWTTALESPKPRVAVGPRSALFLPLRNVGLIVIDEFHEPSYKQTQSPRYSALRAASVLATAHSARLVMGSATPAVSDYFLAKNNGRPIIEMKSRARLDAITPTVYPVDMTKKSSFKRHRFFSDKLLMELEEAFKNNHQALVFHNRRGSASTTLCENCGWSALCPNCFLPLTLHGDTHNLLCHVCGNQQLVPYSCPVCQGVDIVHKGIGTKLIEAELKKIFPNKNIARFDGDTKTTSTVEDRYKDLYDGVIDIIIGTQVIAKGLDLPKLRTVGVVQADAGLSLPDYASSERTFQLLSQVVGRVGRSYHPTSVVVQSYQPAHPAVVDGLAQNYDHFYKTTLIERKKALFPPFTYLLKLVCAYKSEAAAIKNAKNLASLLREANYKDVLVLGPTPAFYERQNDTFRWQLVIKSPVRSQLLKILEHLPSTHWQFELDPASLL